MTGLPTTSLLTRLPNKKAEVGGTFDGTSDVVVVPRVQAWKSSAIVVEILRLSNFDASEITVELYLQDGDGTQTEIRNVDVPPGWTMEITTLDDLPPGYILVGKLSSGATTPRFTVKYDKIARAT